MNHPEDGRIAIGGRRGSGGPVARVRRLRALAAVLALGAGAGAGGVLGLWIALTWAVSGPAGSRSAGGVLLAGGLGVLLGALIGSLLAGFAVVVAASRRRASDAGPTGDQHRSS